MSKNESEDDSCFMGGILNVIIAIANPSKMNLVILAKSPVSNSVHSETRLTSWYVCPQLLEWVLRLCRSSFPD